MRQTDPRREVSRWCDVMYLRALRAIAIRRGDDAAAEALDEQLGAPLAIARELAGPDSPMARLAARFRLDAVQTELLWAAATSALDPRIGAALESLGGVEARRGLSLGLFADLCAVEPEDVHDLREWLDDLDNPIVGLGIAEIGDAPGHAITVPPRVLAYLRGRSVRVPHVTRHEPQAEPPALDERQRAAAERIAASLGARGGAVVVIEGPWGSGRRTAAAFAAQRPLVALSCADVDPARLPAALRALAREAVLTGALPVLSDVDALVRGGADEPGAPSVPRAVGAALDAWPVVVVTSRRPGLDLGATRSITRIRWPIPDAPLRRRLWAAFAADDGEAPAGDLDELAHRYRVGPGPMRRAVATARGLAGGERLDAARLADGLRHNTAERLGGLAKLVTTAQTWDDLVVAEDTDAKLRKVLGRVRHAHRVLDQWGFGSKLALGAGVSVLLSGPPGTGKTMSAALIARELGTPLYQIDLGQIVSKWVGETEKQLARVFDAADSGEVMLLFDEADSLFGKRTADVRGANDRYANLEVNYLLQRIEASNAIVMLTTNMAGAIDEAFKRRLTEHVRFDHPDEAQQVKLWEKYTTTPMVRVDPAVDLRELAGRLEDFSPAHIRNAAVAAAFLAASDPRCDPRRPLIRWEHLVRAARDEYEAMGKNFPFLSL